MRLADAAVSAVTAASLSSAFEHPNFNVTEALSASGVNVTAVPYLAGLVGQSSPKACSIAVSLLKWRIVVDRPNVYVESSVVLSRLRLVTAASYRKELRHIRTSPGSIGLRSKSSLIPSVSLSRQIHCKSQLLSCYLDLRNAHLP